MKKIIVILFLTSYMFSTTTLNQLLKIPVLITHFIEHKESDNMNFWSYLTHHYGGHEIDEDWDTDMKLPFMQQNDLLQLIATSPKTVSLIRAKEIFPEPQDFFSSYDDNFILSGALSAIWQPPKGNA